MSQTNRILKHLKRGWPITPLQALRKYGVLRLGARIWDLKRDGYEIVREWETDGHKRWAKYRMVR